jgi:superfamily II DNA or RNA helicase
MNDDKRILSIIQGREWQLDAFNLFIERFNQSVDTFQVSACPAAGKTRLGIAIAGHYLSHKKQPMVVIVTPSTDIRDEWSKKMLSLLGRNISPRFDAKDFRNLRIDGVPVGVDGFVTTYQTLKSTPESFELLCLKYNVCVILDEVHHCGHSKGWGDAVAHAFGGANLKVGLSGTFYRSDPHPIPFLTYDDGVGRPDFDYPYEKAVMDGVVSAICFYKRQCEVEFINETHWGDLPITLKLGSGKNESQDNSIFQAALDSDFPLELISEAHETLIELRKTHPEAGGLVITNGRLSAKRCVDFIRNTLKSDVLLTMSDMDSDNANLNKFKESDTPWLVSIRKVSEGVDIPRLRVCAYATNINKELSFEQAAGRLTRKSHLDKTPYEQPVFMYMPAEPRLVSHAKSFEQLKLHQIIDIDDGQQSAVKTCPKCDSVLPISVKSCSVCGFEYEVSARESRIYSVLDHQSEKDGGVIHGNEYSQDDINLVKHITDTMMTDERIHPYIKSLDPLIKADVVSSIYAIKQKYDEVR